MKALLSHILRRTISPPSPTIWGRRGLLLGWFLLGSVQAQVPFEVFAGNERATVDLMFFRFIPKAEKEPSKWLFFNRNRASVDYRGGAYLPQFGFTEALSYNHEKAKGFAPVVVGQVLSWGVFPKAGIQFAKVKPRLTIFSWLVTETLPHPDLDFFLLVRYTPRLTQSLDGFFQGESLSTLPSAQAEPMLFTQRIRLGIQYHAFQMGLGSDFTQTTHTVPSHNWGGFIRHVF
jgi:hypothetical protein